MGWLSTLRSCPGPAGTVSSALGPAHALPAALHVPVRAAPAAGPIAQLVGDVLLFAAL